MDKNRSKANKNHVKGREREYDSDGKLASVREDGRVQDYPGRRDSLLTLFI